MDADEAVRHYYDAWQNRGGDFSEVPLAEDFEFTRPVMSRWCASARSTPHRRANAPTRASREATDA